MDMIRYTCQYDTIDLVWPKIVDLLQNIAVEFRNYTYIKNPEREAWMVISIFQARKGRTIQS